MRAGSRPRRRLAPFPSCLQGKLHLSSAAMSLRAGFVGLGAIGRPMAVRLCAAGLPTTVHDVVPDAVDALLAAGAARAGSARDVGAAADVIGVCVRDDADVRAAVLGADGVLAGAAPGAVI